MRKKAERNARIIAQYQAGASLQDISAEHGIVVTRVRQILVASGVARRPRGSRRLFVNGELGTVGITMPVSVEVPDVPSFVTVLPFGTAADIADLSASELERIGEAWTRKLLNAAAARRGSRTTNTPDLRDGVTLTDAPARILAHVG